jgi:formylglycine-generating enzyme required for sulfatase activity
MTPADQPRLQAGGTLNPRRHISIRRPQDEELLTLLLSGEYVNVLTSRQMGKSSLMVRAALELQARGLKFASIDLASTLGSCIDAESYYLGLIGQIARDLKLSFKAKDWWAEHAEETFNQRLLRFFREIVAEGVAGPVVIFLDEIDSTLKLAFTDDLFTALRGIYNDRTLVPAYQRISFCLLGVATPNELIKDRRTTPYNVGRTLELQDFDPAVEDLTPIARALSADTEAGARLLDRVLYWTGGHPYLTVKLCVDLAEAGVASEAEVDRHVDATYDRLERIGGDVHFEQVLRFVANRLSDSLATFDLYERILNGQCVRDQTTLAYAELKLSGLVKRDSEGCLAVRNRIYARLFDRRWVAGSKPRRALAHYRRLALAASMLLVIVIFGMGAFFWWASVHQYPPGVAAEGLLTRVGVLSAIEPEMVSVSAGLFQMGSPQEEAGRYQNEGPVHTVTFARPFAIGKYEVTFAEYDRFAAATGRPLPSDQKWGRGSRPVINVSWQDAKAYATWLSEKTGKEFRLPSESEWEYACRAGSKTAFFFGDDSERLSEFAWFYDNSANKTNPVRKKKPNAWGLYDIAGNVWEWVEDDWHESYLGAPSDGSPWVIDPNSAYHVVRGGGWEDLAEGCRSAVRYRNRSGMDYVGFRLSMSVGIEFSPMK